MPDKYSLAKCEQYGRRLAARLCQQHFGAQPDATLDGPALLKFTSLRQVNLLVLQQLLGRWQHEATQLRSPYFDFEAAPVQAALAQFMNVLSRHISVGRAALEPLLAQAVAYTLLLATDPAAAFERLLLPPAAEGAGAEVPPAYLRERLRYLDAGKALFTGFVDSLPPGGAPLSREFLRQRFELYATSHYKELPALAPLVAQLSALLPLTEADLWHDGPAKPKPGPAAALTPPASAPPPTAPAPTPPVSATTVPAAAMTAPAPAPTPSATVPTAPAPAPAVPSAVPTASATAPTVPAAVSTTPAAASAGPAAVPAAPTAAGREVAPGQLAAAPTEPAAPAEATKLAPTPPGAPAEASAGPEAPRPAPAARPVVPSFVAAPGPAAAPLHEKLRATQPAGPALADTLRGAAGGATTLAERGAPRVGSLRAAISINQRFGFINELFNGEDADYYAAIEQLDQLPTVDAALAYVQQELAPRHDWSRKDEHVGKLLKLIERKFGAA